MDYSTALPALGHMGWRRPPNKPAPEPAPQRVERNLVLAAWALAHRAGFSYLPGLAPDPTEYLTALGLTEVDVEDLLEEAATWLVE